MSTSPPLPGGRPAHLPDEAQDTAAEAILEVGSPLRRVLDEAIAESGGSLKGFTVLAPQNDPFRVDEQCRALIDSKAYRS